LESLGSVTWFASLPAGPIHRNSELTAKVRLNWPQSPNVYLRLSQGFLKCGMGIFLSQHLQGIETLILRGSFPTIVVIALISVLLFYCQLSGMSDLAIGISRFFGIQQPENFDEPLKSQNLPDFWRRWHITLNQWFFHEVYLPLALFFQSRFPGFSTILASTVLLVTAIFIGLWHGFHSTLIFWGFLNGLLLVIFSTFKGASSRWLSWIAVLFLFLIMRFENLSSLKVLAEKLFFFRMADLENALGSGVIFTAGILIILFMSRPWNWKMRFWPALVFGYLVLGFLLGHSDGNVLYPGF
jgi:D-alanyl-lipoteichoic acid acyltransferase DltB (MBOAT superfamily)